MSSKLTISAWVSTMPPRDERESMNVRAKT